MRQRIQRMRQLFVNTLQEKARTVTSALLSTERDVLIQRSDQKIRCCVCVKFGVYAVASGHSVNVAGMTPDNMAPLCEAIVAVL